VMMALEIVSPTASIPLDGTSLRAALAARSLTAGAVFEADGRLMHLPIEEEEDDDDYDVERIFARLEMQVRLPLLRLGVPFVASLSPRQAADRIRRARRQCTISRRISRGLLGASATPAVSPTPEQGLGADGADGAAAVAAAPQANGSRPPCPWREGCLLSGRALVHLDPVERHSVCHGWRPPSTPLLLVSDLVGEIRRQRQRHGMSVSRRHEPPPLRLVADLHEGEPPSALLLVPTTPPRPPAPVRKQRSYEKPRSPNATPEAQRALLTTRPALPTPPSPKSVRPPPRLLPPPTSPTSCPTSASSPTSASGSPRGAGGAAALLRLFAAPRKERLCMGTDTAGGSSGGSTLLSCRPGTPYRPGRAGYHESPTDEPPGSPLSPSGFDHTALSLGGSCRDSVWLVSPSPPRRPLARPRAYRPASATPPRSI
jgi:hypothetical protein